ncbi:DUF2156 domain-containing protein [Microbacterium sp. 1P10UB]|uniref:bifunctional lysylphosphatidylglycerol flippase/synthetase MprF n=1 Tax=unclassified Microbacterium TaxID=2609290 RepID=UPI0039A30FF5
MEIAQVDGASAPVAARRRLSGGVVVLRSYLRRNPVAVSFALLILLTGIASGSLWGSEDAVLLGWGAASLGAPATWWTTVTALIIPDSTVDAVLSMLLALSALAIAERLLGVRRTIVAMAATGFVALFVGAGAQAAVAGLPEVSDAAAQTMVLDPTIPIAGAVAASSALAGVLWRRRLRIVTFAALGMFALYAGDVDSWFRLIAALLGLLLGFGLARGAARRSWHRSSSREIRSLLAVIVAVTGLGPIAALVAGGGRGPLSLVADAFTQSDNWLSQRCERQYVPACDHEFALLVTRGAGPAILAIIPLALLVLAAWGLRNGRRSAWILAVAVNASLAALAIITLALGDISFPDPVDGATFEWALWFISSAILPIGVIVVLALNQRRFRVRASARARRTWGIVVGVAFVACAGAFLLVSSVLTRSFDVTPTLADLLTEMVRRFIPPAFLQGIGQPPFPRGGAALVVYQWVGVVFWVVFIVATLRLFRSTALPEGSDSSSLTLYRSLLRRGGGTLSFLGTWRGNAHWFSDDLQSAVAYRVVGGVALAVADPLCPRGREGSTLRGFADFAISRGWTPVFYSIHDDFLPAFEAMGWHTVEVGQETVMHLPDLQMAGKQWQKVRSPLNRAEREGMTAQWTRWRDLPAGVSSQIIDISEQWVTDKSLPEMGFTLGGLEELDDPDVALLLAVDATGRVQAVTSWMPSWQDGRIVGWTLDFMRRRDDAPNGVMEFLIAKAALLMKDDGVQVLSLSGAPLATRPRAEGESVAEPTALSAFLGWLAGVLEPVYGFASLFRFKSKFLPEYRTMYMAYADPVELGSIGAAVGRAYLPDASPREYVAVVRTLLAPPGRAPAGAPR